MVRFQLRSLGHRLRIRRVKIQISGIFVLLGVLVYLMIDPLPGWAQDPPFVPGEILVKFWTEAGLSAAETFLQAQGLRLLEVSHHTGVMRVATTPGREAEVVTALVAQPAVQFAGLNYIVSKAGSPNDPYFNLQWNLH